jgi:hypothetical protein
MGKGKDKFRGGREFFREKRKFAKILSQSC